MILSYDNVHNEKHHEIQETPYKTEQEIRSEMLKKANTEKQAEKLELMGMKDAARHNSSHSPQRSKIASPTKHNVIQQHALLFIISTL